MNRYCENIEQIKSEVGNVQLVVVSKYRKLEELEQVYACGQRAFAENRVQELISKHEEMPSDVEWHLIGHLQSNKVKYIAPFVHLIHAVDSIKLLKKIDQEAEKNNRTIKVLMQVHIADEEHKFGFSADALRSLLSSSEFKELKHVECKGLMGMATNTTDEDKIAQEFAGLNKLFKEFSHLGFDTLSMGMSGDYKIAVANGSTIIRVGSKVFA